MEITGKIILVLPERGGVSASTGNEWRMGSYVLETIEQYPRKMCFDVFGGDKIEQFHLMVGELVTVSFDVDAREYQGRWYNSIRAWKVVRPSAQATPPPYPGSSNAQPSVGAAPRQDPGVNPSEVVTPGYDPSLSFPPPQR